MDQYFFEMLPRDTVCLPSAATAKRGVIGRRIPFGKGQAEVELAVAVRKTSDNVLTVTVTASIACHVTSIVELRRDRTKLTTEIHTSSYIRRVLHTG